MTRRRGLLAAVLLVLAACSKPRNHAKVIVLGIDGMDPGFVERHWADLPNLATLRDKGFFQRLQTTVPPQSPVAWSTFMTGLDPGGHGIFDFIHRDPKRLEVQSSLAETIEPRWKLPLGPWILPLSSGTVRSFRRGKAFWQTLGERDVPVTVLRMPNNFPPVECEGLSLAGMGTPDLAGSFGTFSFFSSEPGDAPRDIPGGRFLPARIDHHRAVLLLDGPENSLRRDRARSSIPVTVDIDPEAPVARFEAGGNTFILKEKEWSGWIRVEFPLLGPVASAAGMFRIYVRELHPHLRIYVSPVNLDPEDPGLPLSTPESYSRDLARTVGPYYTQGIAEDTAALRQGALTPDEFVAQATLVAEEHVKLFRYELGRFRSGLLFFHFFGVDQMSHMFWGRDEAKVLGMYRRADALVGEAMSKAPDGEIIVMSDHGFTAFDRAMHLNAWLRAEGLLTVRDGATGSGGLGEIDWSRTQAYAAGLNGLYLNLAGREAQGIVEPESAARIRESIRERLLAARDPLTGSAPVDTVYVPAEIFHGDQIAAAPDLIAGYSAGYRGSWQTALGQTPAEAFEANDDAWIGDHCVAAHLVPGVLAANRRLNVPGTGLDAVTRIVLSRFGVEGK